MVGHGDKFYTCREVLQRGLFLNRNSAALIQVRYLAFVLSTLRSSSICTATVVLWCICANAMLWVQAWGLMELQKGNILAAVLLLVSVAMQLWCCQFVIVAILYDNHTCCQFVLCS